mmetsp:Transcript_23565/g.52196  ORF Transcript_23565/g.52196 Transcript_23565/m.52196 type:complete len:135 (-) Transcript_23565:75-479(-)
MALRLCFGRLSSRATVPLGFDSAQATKLKDSGGKLVEKVQSFSFRQFFEEKHFWNKANVGPFFLLLLFTPTIYRSVKDAYWTRQLRRLSVEELVSDRYEWLRLAMLRDEVEAAVLKQAPAQGVASLALGPSLPP